MKNDIIRVNNVGYIKLSKYKELQKKKITIKKVIKEVPKEIIKEVETDKIKLKDYAILDPVNVCGIFPFIKKDSSELEFLDTPLGYYKKINNPKITIKCNSLNNEEESIIIEETKYSREFINQIIKIGSVWFDKKPIIFMEYDKALDKFLRDMPLMLIFGNKMCFILAPRVESSD